MPTTHLVDGVSEKSKKYIDLIEIINEHINTFSIYGVVLGKILCYKEDGTASVFIANYPMMNCADLREIYLKRTPNGFLDIDWDKTDENDIRYNSLVEEVERIWDV